jgi:hypothetical protein
MKRQQKRLFWRMRSVIWPVPAYRIETRGAAKRDRRYDTDPETGMTRAGPSVE